MPVFGRRSCTHAKPTEFRSSKPRQERRRDPIPLHPVADPPVVSDFAFAISKAMEAGNVEAVLGAWEAKRRRLYPGEWPAVRKAFEASVQTVLYRLKRDHVKQACLHTSHALGDVRASEARLRENAFAEDTSPAYPVMMLLYDLMERNAAIPLWQDVEKYLFENQEVCLAYFYEAGGLAPPASVDDMWVGSRYRAIRYRIANLYNSFIREVDAIVYLREKHGLDVRCHSLLDTEWKSDAVCGLVRIELFVVNSKFKKLSTEELRQKMEGRKKECQAVNPGLPVAIAPMEPSDEWGCVWLFTDKALDELAARINAESAAH